MNVKKIADKFETIEKEYDKSFDNLIFNSMTELHAHRLQFLFAKMSEMMVEIDNLKDELREWKGRIV